MYVLKLELLLKLERSNDLHKNLIFVISNRNYNIDQWFSYLSAQVGHLVQLYLGLVRTRVKYYH